MRLLVIGYGYSAQSVHRALTDKLEGLVVTTRTPDKQQALANDGLRAVVFDGTQPSDALSAELEDATHLLISAAPDEGGDPFLRHHNLSAANRLRGVAYLSTVGVYGNHDGAWVDETTTLQPESRRSVLRLEAEAAWEKICSVKDIPLSSHRLSGIYGPERNPLVRVLNGQARRIIKPGQVFNRIHVADIGRVVAAALLAEYNGPLNVTDDMPAPPQDVLEHAASLLGTAPPPAVDFETADLTPMARSFYGENKRVSNALSKRLFGSYLYPDYKAGLASLLD